MILKLNQHMLIEFYIILNQLKRGEKHSNHIICQLIWHREGANYAN